MKKRCVFLLSMLLVLTLLFTGQSFAADKKLEIAVLLPAAGDPYFAMKSFGYVDEAKNLGVDVKIYDAGGYGNLTKQVQQIEDVIQRGVNGIVLVPSDSVGTVPAVEKAIAAGIPVINDGIATKSPKVTAFVGEPSYAMGKLQAVYMAEQLKGEGEIILFLGPAGLDLSNFRAQGFKDYISRYPKIKIVAEKYTGTASAETMKAMEDFLQAFPNVNAVYTFNGPIMIGVVQALRAGGKKPGEVIVTTLDLEVETERLMKSNWCQMTVVSEPVRMARLALRAAVDAAKGKEVTKEILTQDSMITRYTMGMVDLSGQQTPSDWKGPKSF